MRWVLGHSQEISPEVEWVAVVAGHVEPVAAIAGPTEWIRDTEYCKLLLVCWKCNLR